MSSSPALPWEVIERVIDHSNDTRTLYSFTLTCHDLRPRSTMVLLRHVTLENRNQLFDLCDVLRTKPHLLPCVQSVKIPADEFSPYPLLHILPKLSEVEFTESTDLSTSEDTDSDSSASESTDNQMGERPLIFHASVLKCCHQFGQRIRTLSLHGLQFSSLAAFSHILLSLPRIESLSCTDVRVKNDTALAELVTQRLSERLHLKTLTVRGDNDNRILTMLREATKRSLAALTYKLEGSDLEIRAHQSTNEVLLASPSDWVQLTSFILMLADRGSSGAMNGNPELEHAVNTLRNFRPPNLRLQEVTVDVLIFSLHSFFADFVPTAPELCAELDKTLITFPRPTLSLSCRGPINTRQYHSWMHMLETVFPALAERSALTINAEHSGFAGHDGGIETPIITSLDSRWAATGSSDGTIIIWDLDNGRVAQEWFTGDKGVMFLAFSPDSRYILSVGRDGWAPALWDLHQGGRRVRSLKPEGATPGLFWRNRPWNYAWSPDGTWIMATGSTAEGDAVHIWDTTTFQLLHAWKGSYPLALSADGCWVAAAPALGERSWLEPELTRLRGAVLIWNVKSGELHRRLKGHAKEACAAAFNPTSTRIATGSEDSTIRIWDVQTGEQLLVLPGRADWWIDAVAFSGDGRMVLSNSFPSYGDDLSPETVQAWDASNGALLASLPETYRYGIWTPCSACFSPCGSYVVSVSDDKGALLWRTSDWSCIAEVSCGGASVARVAISPDGRVLCCGTEAGTVFFRRMHDLVSTSQD